MMRYLLAGLVLLLVGCAASAQTRSGSVDVDALLRQHPLYGTLAQYDRQIAALQSTLHTRFANGGAQIDNARAAIQHALSAAAKADRAYPHLVWHSPFTNHTVTSAGGGANGIAASVQSAYQAQHAQLRSAAKKDMAAYRADVLAQEQSAYETFVQSVNARVQRAYDARAQELREKESTLLLNLARTDASQRLLLRAKLQTLALSSATRSRFEARLAALQNREDAQVDALRRRDADTLRAYAAQLRARGEHDIAAMQADLQTRTAGNLAERERVLAAQTSTGGTLPLPSSRARVGSMSRMQAQYNALVNAQTADPSAFQTASGDLSSRFNAVKAANAQNTQSVESQIASLRHDRQAVRERIIAQIMLEARQEAKARGLSSVSAASHPAAGSVDLTSAVAGDIRALTP